MTGSKGLKICESTASGRCRLHVRRSAGPLNTMAMSQYFGREKRPMILGGAGEVSEQSRFSYFACEPIEVFEFFAGDSEPFEKLQRAIDKYQLVGAIPDELPSGVFCGGWMGYFSYELGRYIEKLPANAVDDFCLPLIQLCFYDRLICYDGLEKKIWLVALEIEGQKQTVEEKFCQLENAIVQAGRICASTPAGGGVDGVDASAMACNMNKEYYLESFKRIKKYIYEGDVYQINFSQRFCADFDGESVDLFNWQNRYNPSPFGAFIDSGDFQIVSASPELFVRLQDGVITTRPIKGTRPRSDNEQLNKENRLDLFDSEKEKAELNMIIDLERNDLGRICKYGSIKVTEPRTIESYSTVLHAVAMVQGQLRDEITFADCLKAIFPGGSITGAPKIRAMEIIDELEPTQRSVYTGCIGFIGVDGNACLNIAIRTIIIKAGIAYAQAGGGIVSDSEPEAEWEETLIKAKALVTGIEAANKKIKY